MFNKHISIAAILSLLCFTAISSLPGTTQAATIELLNFNAVMSSSTHPTSGYETLSLLVNSSRYGAGGFAGGQYRLDGKPPPDDNMPAISFTLAPDSSVLGPDPVPFRLFMAKPPPDDNRPATLIGELDFSSISGYRDSLQLSGLQVLTVDSAGRPTGDIYDVAPFTIQSVPPSPSLLLMVFGLAGLMKMKKSLP